MSTHRGPGGRQRPGSDGGPPPGAQQGAAPGSGSLLDAFDRHYRDIFGYLARRIDASTAEDLASETFVRALEHRTRFDPSRGDERAWLFGIATNLLSKHRRAEVRGYQAYARLGADPVIEAPVVNATIDRVDAQAQGRALAGALARLRAEERDVLLLVAHADMTYGQVAEALDVPTGTVR